MKIIVQKFGGTSVSTEDKRTHVVEKVSKAIENGLCPVVVVSAMGRIGEPYATDTLLTLLDGEVKEKNPLAVDLLMSCGEIISTVVMCNELSRKGFNAVPLTGGQAGIITDNTFNNANVLSVNTDCILELLKENKVPVIAGFQGQDQRGFFTTLGRGGSDVTASLIGAALKAEEIEIYTDVDGIMTADPRIVSEASLIKEISYNEVFQFADHGAKVIHPRAVEIAMRANIPLVIKNTMNDCSGTMVNSVGIPSLDTILTGITHMGDRVQVKVVYDEINDRYNSLLDVLAENLISIDLINVFPKEKIFTIDQKDLQKIKVIFSEMNLTYSFIENCSKIAVIGSRIRGVPGVMAKILKVLIKENIEILQTADSHTTIWCLVHSQNVQRAINALHREFELG